MIYIDAQLIFCFHKADVRNYQPLAMRIFKFRKPKQTVTVSILHHRSEHPDTVEFMNIYRLENNPDLDIKELMQTAFQKAHPDWTILGVNMQLSE